MKTTETPPNTSRQSPRNSPFQTIAINRKALQKSLQEAALKSRKKQKELWCIEIMKYHQIISEAFFSGAPKMEIHKTLVNLGFKIPQKAFLFYFENKVSPRKKRLKIEMKPREEMVGNSAQSPKETQTNAQLNPENTQPFSSSMFEK